MRRFLTIIIILLLVVTGVWYFYVRPREMGVAAVPSILKPFFPTSTTNPLAGSGSNATNSGAAGSGSGTNISNSPFKQITGQPVAGYAIFSVSNTLTIPAVDPKSKPTTQTVVDHMLRYVSRSNGYVYEIKDGGIPLQISNVYIPNIYQAYFADGDNTAILRFLRSDNETIATYSVPIPPLNTDGTRTQKAGIYLPDNIFNMTVSPDGTQVVRVTTDIKGAVITSSNTGGASIKTLAISPFTEWIPIWANKTVYLQTKASAYANGFLYSINPTTARLQRIVGDAPGLTTSVSPSGTYVLYSESTQTGFVTKLLNTKTGSVADLSLAILPENCAWLQNENLICAGNSAVSPAIYPDAWYSGLTHLSDQLYDINSANNTYTVLYNDQGASYDMTDLQVDEGQQLVYFIDKNTGLLWQFAY
jgi:hypothetical protein